jgi:hypothetical protein
VRRQKAEGRRQNWLRSFCLLLSAFCLLPSGFAAVIDDFDSVSKWSAHPSDGVSLNIAEDAGAMRLDFDFQGHGGYAIARCNVDLDLPPNYQFRFRIRGETPPQTLEFKLIDASGDNVWWTNRRDFTFPRDWTTLRTNKRKIEFAWGPIGGGEIQHVAALEIVITAATGGKGTVWIDDLSLDELSVAPTTPQRFESSTIDLGIQRELGGLTIEWKNEPHEFAVFLDDHPVGVGQTLLSVPPSAHETGQTGVSVLHAGRFVWLPDAEARIIRVEGGEVRAVTVQPPTWAKTENDFFAIVARAAPRGAYPRYLIGEQPYWTVIGADGADEEALVGEDGAVEPFKGGPSIEPFLRIDGKLVTWADVEAKQSLLEGDLPIPTVTWTKGSVSLTITAAVSASSMLEIRYRVRGDATLLLALRPFQVNPSTQFLNTIGGVAHASVPPAAGRPFLAMATGDGRPAAGGTGVVPDATEVFSYPNNDVTITIPLHAGAKSQSFETIAADWREKLHRVALDIAGAPDVAATIRSNVAYMLIHRDGPAIEPGSRSYDRSWIRDGALISSILLRLGHAGVARDFARWFAPHQYPNGKVPCCVDRRGADPVPENDSHGQLIFLIAEIYRTTRDLALVRELWPHVDAAARHIEELRSQNHGEFEGLVTESISHEGYSAKPVHSYWDDVFALKGMDDAVFLAGALGLDARRQELAAQAGDFRNDLATSIRNTIAKHALDYVPASVELADFDPTSTAIGISPLGLTSLLPQRELARTYERYFAAIARPRVDYTPYEMRIIGALIRLGDRDRALQLIDRFLLDRRPAAWNEWAEVVGTTYREPRFIGDMPHVWIASDFMRSVLDAIAYDREDGALVIGAGVPARWLPLRVGPLATYHGTIEIRMRRSGREAVVDLSGDAHPPGGVVVVSPFDPRVTQRVDALPARVRFRIDAVGEIR